MSTPASMVVSISCLVFRECIVGRTKFSFFLAAISAAVLWVAFSSGRLMSQAFEAQLTGVVKDQSGAVVPGAQLKVTNLATHVSYSGTSNDQGIYRFPSLPPAEYSVTCSVQGFKTFQQNRITLQVAQVFELNVNLQAGEMSEQVTVTAAPPPLETESATLGQVVTTRSVQNLPLNIRDPMALVALTPGVILGSNFGNGGGNDVGRNFFKSDFNVGGGRSGSQEILMDGAPDTTPDINRGVINPPVDSVQEFKVQAQSFDAQFGRTSGGIVNVITKSGSNDYHGVGYDFERHSVLDANNWFNNANRQALPSFQRHQFGGNLGGPILHSKWFAFGDYEGLRQGYPQTSLSTVPTALQRQGDFSQTFTSAGALIQVYDPATVVTLPNGTRQRTAFPGNVIPTSRFSPVAQGTLGFLPLPNLAGNPLTGQNNYIYSADSTLNSNKYDLRTDANFTRSHAHVRTILPAAGRTGSSRHSAASRRRRTLHDRSLHAGGCRFEPCIFTNACQRHPVRFYARPASQYGASQGFNLSQLNLPAAYHLSSRRSFLSLTSATPSAPPMASDSFTQFQPRNIWSTLGSVTWQHGKHSLKFGGDWRMLNFNEGQNSSALGTFSFGRQFTQGPERRAGQHHRRLWLCFIPAWECVERERKCDQSDFNAGRILRRLCTG